MVEGLGRSAVVLCFGLVLAGCLSSPQGTPAPSSSAPATHGAPAAAAAPAAPSTTDVLHLLDRSRLTTDSPRDAQPMRIPINSIASIGTLASGSPQSSLWNFTWQKLSQRVDGNLSLVVDVEGLVLNQPFASVPGQTQCFWNLSIDVYDPSVGSQTQGGFVACLNETQVVPDGVRTLSVPFSLPEGHYLPGWTAFISIGANAYAQSPDARVDLLTGSVQQDSTVSFDGYGWPLDLGQVTLLT